MSCGNCDDVVKFECPPGRDGYNGWTPKTANVADGNRIVQNVVDWYGGTGPKPTVVNVYLGATGFVEDIALATDIRGTQGVQGVVGPKGNDGEKGDAWTGLIPGGDIGESLKKFSTNDGETTWGFDYKTIATSASIDVGVDQPNPITFTVPNKNNTLAIAPGVRIRFTHPTDSSIYLEGPVQSYSLKNIVVKIDDKKGTGTYNSWKVNLGGSGLDYNVETNFNGITPEGVQINSAREALDFLLDPKNSDGTPNPHKSNYIKGGHHNNFDSIDEINAIPAVLVEDGTYAILNPSFTNLENYDVDAGLVVASVVLVNDKLIVFGQDQSSIAKIYVVDPITLVTIQVDTVPSSGGRTRALVTYGSKVYFSGGTGAHFLMSYDVNTYSFSSPQTILNDPIRPTLVNGYLYMAQKIEGKVEYINLNGAWGATTIISGIVQPWTFGYDDVNDRVFVFPWDSNLIRYIDNASSSPVLNVGSINIPGGSAAHAYCNDILREGNLYFTSFNGNKLWRISTGTTPALNGSVTVGSGPDNSIYFGGKVYVTNQTDGSVSVVKINDFSGVYKTIDVGSVPIGSDSSSMIRTGNYIFVPCYGDSAGGVISVIDAILDVNIKDYITTGQTRSIVYYAKTGSVFGGSNNSNSLPKFSYNGLKVFASLNKTWVEITAPSLYGGILKGAFSYEQDFSNEFIDDSYLPDIRYVKSIMPVFNIVVSLTAAQVLQLFSNQPDVIPSPGPGKAIVVTNVEDYNKYAGVPYSGNTTIEIFTDTATIPQYTEARCLQSTVERGCKFSSVPMSTTQTDTQIIGNKSVKIRTAGGNPSVGNSPLKIYLTYKIIDL
jgi:hypothetical protein